MHEPDFGPSVAPSSLDAPSVSPDIQPEHAASGFALFHAALLPDAERFLRAHDLLGRSDQLPDDLAAGLVASLMVHRGGAFPDRQTAWSLLDMADLILIRAECVREAAAGRGALLMNEGYYLAGEPTNGPDDDFDTLTVARRAA